MKRYDTTRADSRTIDEKALGLIFAMTDDQALALHRKLTEMAGNGATDGQRRANMFLGLVTQ